MEQKILSRRSIALFYAGFLAVYLCGMLVPLMQNDSAQHASMAMRMALSGDFLNIYKGENPYLDKPHLHFWLAAISMKFFGINHFAYRIPAVLCLFMAAFSTKKLADLLYRNENLSHCAALIFLSAQTIILSAHDVRTDAVLTGFIAFAIWQFVKFIQTQKISSATLAGFSTAMAFSTKGQMAVVIIGLCIFSYLLYSREWRRFFNAKIFFSAAAFLVGIFPVVFAYNHQFGLEGVKFILFNQSLNRLTASGFTETSPDYFFFFHTLLWAFLPFSLLFYCGVFQRTFWFFKNKFQKTEGAEFLTLGGFWLVMLLFSFSKFKLPHYLNGLIPVISVFTAAYLFLIRKENRQRLIKVLWKIQLVVIFSGIVGIFILTEIFTGIPKPILYMVSVFVLMILLNRIFVKENLFSKYLKASLLFSIGMNLFLNSQFYPVLTQFQGPLKQAEFVNSQSLPKEKIFMLKDDESWAFDFYTKRNTPRIIPENLRYGDYLLTDEVHLEDINRHYKIINSEKDFRITRLSLKFLNPQRRESQLGKKILIQITD
ncbi:4-amino-4-deoxy-L-arabinose transferase [Cruoricaptor ignavus]|uniref:4-amino-4-deoxy-L-arabinose transferase n=1 Tax=Cruoricaptor ignavus TaxID=1118202 RepID=A0A1M6F937_9FLAO|nr:glycosyltransferase family 39 protein [Cruoricaptor ignavus]SHI94190.1 4-amino-4-deoxy-L-arabinose transferase [Cruoricaptor ignavus]